MNNKERIQDVYRMIAEGKSQDAFEQYYHEEVEMIEGDGTRAKGKQANRERHQEWYNSLEGVNGAGVNAITADDNNEVTMVESWNDFTFKGGQNFKMEQIARQKWKDGQIIEERFYYNPKP